ncbi:FeoA family protein [Ottowia sp. VDI28]|uniref:FeoA family protein n=1 Tax=Ottowia sp. VDI28 TaxID=3133968 RepID=UPI003C2BEAF2
MRIDLILLSLPMAVEFPSPPVVLADNLRPLHALPRGARGVIEHLGSPAQEGDREVLLRLLEIGFLPGETVRVIAHGRRGAEPVAVRIGQATFALRAREAALIRVRPLAAEQECLA